MEKKKIIVKNQRQKLRKKLDEAWSLKIREKRICELCGARGALVNFDAHHIRKRSNLSTRWDLDNGVCLCKGCHRFKVHLDTFTASVLIEKLKKNRGKKWYNKLVKKSNQITRYSLQELKDLLKKYD